MAATSAIERYLDGAIAATAAVLLSLALAVGYATYHLRFGLAHLPFGFPVSFYVLGVAGLLQFARIVGMASWRRRAAAFGSVLGLAATVAGLGPRGGCELHGDCITYLNLDPPLVAVGLSLLMVTIGYDLLPSVSRLTGE